MFPWTKAMFRHLSKAAMSAFRHGIFATAKAVAYSSTVVIFPALIVFAWALAATKTTPTFIRQITDFAGLVIPTDARAQVLQYFQGGGARPAKLIISASFVLFTAASGVMMSLMEGFRRAYGIQVNPWSHLRERAVSLFLVLLGFMPMILAMSMIAFSTPIRRWLFLHADKSFYFALFLFFQSFRWAVSAIASITVIMLIYHWGLPRVQHWRRVLPGAILATVLWFPVTVGFGWYVNNYANYTIIYGTLGAAIALLVWMYLIAIIILFGAEFNAVVCPREGDEDRRIGIDRRQGDRRRNE